MGDFAVKVDSLTKVYRLYDSPLHRVKESFNPFVKKYHRDFHALNDVSLEIGRGETVGIVGRNGSGKSTLLKIITGVLTPTAGNVAVQGNVSALLELGAGFNPELTGLENVYFSGALQGYNREQMAERLGDIVTFAEIGEFINQPVKTYSSGMYVRLAFAVSISVSPDILIVDEALSVGDEAFQRKCFARIDDFRKAGKTIIFVTHSMGAITEFCDRAILLDQGEFLVQGKPKAVVNEYYRLLYAPEEKRHQLRENLKSTGSSQRNETAEKDPAVHPAPKAFFDPDLKPKSTFHYESRGARIINPRIENAEGEPVNILIRGKEYTYRYDIRFDTEAVGVRYGAMFKTTSGFELGGLTSGPQMQAIGRVGLGATLKAAFTFRCNLLPNVYFLNSGVMGRVGDEEVFLCRAVDIDMFRVQEEPGLTSLGFIDLGVDQPTEQGAI